MICSMNALVCTVSYPSVSTRRWNNRNGGFAFPGFCPDAGDIDSDVECDVCVTSVCADGRLRMGDGEKVNSTSRMEPSCPEKRRILLCLWPDDA